MARPRKNNAEYFSHDAGMRDDPKIKALRKKFKSDGYSVWCMLLELLTASENFKYKWNELNIEIVAGDFDIDSARIKEIVDYMVLLELVTIEDGFIFSAKLIGRFSGLLAKRARDNDRYQPSIPEPETNNNGVSADENKNINGVSADENTQSIVQEKREYILSQFDEFRKLYPGTKRGNETEFKNFQKHKDWQIVLPLLKTAIEKQIEARIEKKKSGGFIPEWKNLQTWINKRCWEEEITQQNTEIKPEPQQKQQISEFDFESINKQRVANLHNNN